MRISSESEHPPEPTVLPVGVAAPSGARCVAGRAGVVPAGPTTLTVCPDGPILVRGDFQVLDPEGRPLPRDRATIALCRCGLSRLAPLCDGTHKVAGFRSDDRHAESDEPESAAS